MSGDDRQNSPSISRQNRPSATAIVVLAFTKERSKQDILIEEMEEEKVDTSPEGDFYFKW